MADKHIEHHGVLGMKWGVRRGSSRVSTRKTSKDSGSEDYKTARTLKSRGSKNLSTKELKDLNQRLQLEKQFKDLSPSEYAKGIKVVKNITATGTTLASLYALSKTPLAQDIRKAVVRR